MDTILQRTSMAHVAKISPYLYAATAAFTLSACSSDLLSIRLSLTGGFLFLVLASLSGNSTDGSFHDMPLFPTNNDTDSENDREIHIPMLINACLFVLNFYICTRLVADERPQRKLNDSEKALFRFFQARCGLTPLEFHHILRHGEFVTLSPHSVVPHTHCTLYLVLEGRVHCTAKQKGKLFGKSFVKRSGEFFDVKLFNLFSLPVGFDSMEFVATTETETILFAWNVDGIVAMRDQKSPALRPFWDVMVLRALVNVAIRNHLKANDTLYDSLLVPEESDWLQGAPSRDFGKLQEHPKRIPHGRQILYQQVQILRQSFFHIIPPRGVRHRPSIGHAPNPKQAYMELVSRTTAPSPDPNFRFLATSAMNDESNRSHRTTKAPIRFLTNHKTDVEAPAAIRR